MRLIRRRRRRRALAIALSAELDRRRARWYGAMAALQNSERHELDPDFPGCIT